jgi:hypothetical protein
MEEAIVLTEPDRLFGNCRKLGSSPGVFLALRPERADGSRIYREGKGERERLEIQVAMYGRNLPEVPRVARSEAELLVSGREVFTPLSYLKEAMFPLLKRRVDDVRW